MLTSPCKIQITFPVTLIFFLFKSASMSTIFYYTSEGENDIEDRVFKKLGKCKQYTLHIAFGFGLCLILISFILFGIGVMNRGDASHNPLVILAIVFIVIGGTLSFTCRFIYLCIATGTCCFRRLLEEEALINANK